MEKVYDIAIIGAGPGGVATALSLLKDRISNDLNIIIIDKAVFPREKVCGDAVPYWVFNDLEEVCAGIHKRMKDKLAPASFSRTRMVTDKNNSATVEWSQPGYMIPRSQLDFFLLEELRAFNRIEIKEGTSIDRIRRNDNLFTLFGSDQKEILKTRFIIGSDGAPSKVAKSLLPAAKKTHRSGAAVRGYFSGLEIKDPGTSLVYYSRKFSPGYFWFFPISSTRANVGFGMTNHHRQKRNLNLNDVFWYFTEAHPEICRNFNTSHLEAPLKGGFLPFSSGVGKVVGKGFALVGDAAYLNDPATGDGIRNAVLSGIMAGKALTQVPAGTDLNSMELIEYQSALKKRLHKTLKFRARIVSLVANVPGLVGLSVWIGGHDWIIRRVKKWI